MLYIAFLWHMHQPFYLDWEKGSLALPWVRLHAVKAYFDLPYLLAKYPQVKNNFNLVPSLLLQLRHYEEGKTDIFLELSRKPASELSPEEKAFLLKYFFSCHWETHIYPFPRYHELLALRGGDRPQDIERALDEFSNQDFLDLQVWFNLTWIGFGHRSEPLIKELLAKERLFTEEEKNLLLDLHIEVIKKIIPLYKELQEKGQIEISTSPFFHPILPLLIDSDMARRNLPHAPLPPRFNYPDDAAFQVEKALEYHQELFDKKPKGLWPSEGSVCPELIPIVAQAGLSWMATDEEILYKSLWRHGPAVLMKPYLATHENSQIAMVFRHHGLSDRIGFVYRTLTPEDAVSDLINTAKGLARESGLENPLLTLILDGENPWEYYADGGEGFLSALFEKITSDPEIASVTISEYLDKFPPQEEITNLYTGSWINANFDIWIGHEEENQAWELLGRTRRVLNSLKEVPEKARQAIMAAEGSDWFWWYGDHFTSLFDAEFDRLFRGHLQEVFKALGKEPIVDLFYPVRKPKPIEPEEIPVAFIKPVIDGRETFFFEWIGAGRFLPSTAGEAMYLGESLVVALYFGFDLTNFYLRLDFKDKIFDHLPEDLQTIVTFSGSKHKTQIMFKPKAKDITKTLILVKGPFRLYGKDVGEIALDRILELAVSFENLGFVVGEKVNFHLEFLENSLIRERIPRTGNLLFTVPDENFEQEMWLA
ncbi:glycoside hydrolase family 57 [Thermodesulfatator indicus DSM 15286]|uniref:Glycoside hydrolase family 57 n=1 Tax=Thermodesulfatator indicus (strain DSM 15286 / JCM 11887 / CIR29812) TaxID=667014 RepID=F8A7Y2_THEID|nr:glycoside hydrolase family 57 protein [Thermodesulfatator indicus]AEH43898.1 glycoside hydrolase family 57 [Thermodesulfatator indicus DSM 15286]